MLRLATTRLEFRDLDGEIIVLDLESDRYLSVNRTGARLWRALESGTTRAELVDGLVGAHGVERSTAERDVDAFLARARELGWIVESD